MAYLTRDSVINSVLPLLQQYNPQLTGQALTAFVEKGESGSEQQKPLKPMTRQEVCDYLSISLSSVNRYMKDGRLKAIHIGSRLVRIDPRSVQALISR